jgi:hypothetical protein
VAVAVGRLPVGIRSYMIKAGAKRWALLSYRYNIQPAPIPPLWRCGIGY